MAMIEQEEIKSAEITKIIPPANGMITFVLQQFDTYSQGRNIQDYKTDVLLDSITRLIRYQLVTL
jgi:hypothetical protein